MIVRDPAQRKAPAAGPIAPGLGHRKKLGVASMTAASIPVSPQRASDSLAALAEQINTAHRSVVRNNRESVLNALRAGELLTEAKAQIEHGGWKDWVAENF